MRLRPPHALHHALWAAVLAAALAAGCTESGARTAAPAPDPMAYRANPAASDVAFFAPTGIAKPYVVYGESTAPYKNDRVAPPGTYIAAVSSAPAAAAPATSAAPLTASVQPPMTAKVLAAPAPAPAAIVINGGAVAAYQPVIGVIPNGVLMDVQAWVSHDLRYVNINIHASQTNILAIPYVNIGP